MGGSQSRNGKYNLRRVPKPSYRTIVETDHAPERNTCQSTLRSTSLCENLLKAFRYDPKNVQGLKRVVQGWVADGFKEEVILCSSLTPEEITKCQDLLDQINTLEDQESEIGLKCWCAMKYILTKTGCPPSTLFVEVGFTSIESHAVNGGGCSDVFRGLLANRRVALKAFRSLDGESGRIQQASQETYREALFWQPLSHPFIVPLLGVSKTAIPGRICLISPWMENGNIKEHLKKMRHNKREVNSLQLLREIAEGLNYLRLKHFVHGDIKSSNILIDHSGHACLTDLGLTTISASQCFITKSGRGGGTTRWMAPELLEEVDKHASYESDVYAFGMTMYEVLSGRIPFHDVGHDGAVAVRVVRGERPDTYPLQEYNPSIQEELWNLIQRCWHQRPECRPDIQKVLQVLRRLEAVHAAGCSII